MTSGEPSPVRPSAGKQRIDRVSDALRFAARAHHRQTRKDGRTPYITHPTAVMRILSSEIGVTDPDLLCAAVLHDVLEDTPRTPAQLRAHFGPRVARWVGELTVPHKFHGPRVPDSTKTAVLVGAVGRISWPAILVKLADRVDNLRDSGHALWSSRKRQAFRGQTREILRAVERRLRRAPPPRGLAEPIERARRLMHSELD